LAAQVQAQSQFTLAVNGRFKGGHITRHYGQPQQNVHAIQLEMCQSTYMDESHPFAYRPDLAQQVQPLLKQMIEVVLQWGQVEGGRKNAE
ncbi:MAG: N-formylglutamate amidohydrolase, partial [Burkholderiales bacterium]|nr:N-formylglutamate amidohydrolase [Burkholderiales bacterium]